MPPMPVLRLTACLAASGIVLACSAFSSGSKAQIPVTDIAAINPCALLSPSHVDKAFLSTKRVGGQSTFTLYAVKGAVMLRLWGMGYDTVKLPGRLEGLMKQALANT